MRWPWQRRDQSTSAAASRRRARDLAPQFAVDVPPEMLEGMTAGGLIEPRISRVEALQVPAVLRARNLVCGSLATLPIRVHDRDRRVVTGVPYLVPQPDPEIPTSVMLAQTIEDLMFEGVSWWRITRFGWHGYPVEAHHVPVDSVHVAQPGNLLPSQAQISPDQPIPRAGQVFIDGVPVPDDEIIRFDSPNPPLLRHAARAIRTCLMLDSTASTYARDPLPLGYFTPREGVDPGDDDEIQALLDKWEDQRRTRAWGYVGAALEPHTVQWSPEQLQLAEARQHAVLEIARATGLDPEDLGVSTTSRTYQNAEQRRRDLLDFTLAPYVRAIEERLSMRDVLPRGYRARFDFGGFLRADTKTRMETYEVGMRVGAYTEEEIRELEDRPPLTTRQRVVRQRQASSPSEEETPVRAARAAYAAFHVAETTNVEFDAPEVAAAFRVNVQQRTISGLAVPWGRVARSGYSRWRFERGALHWSSPQRVKLNLHHDPERAIGYATELRDTDAGLFAVFRVAAVPEGDRALALAKDGVLDGLSIEVDFEDGDLWEPDPHDESVRLVRRAKLRGVALTAMPAFDDARLENVIASRDQETNGMETKGTTAVAERPTNGAAAQFDLDAVITGVAERIADSHRALVKDLSQSFGESLGQNLQAALESLVDPQGEGRQPVSAVPRFRVTREAPVYTLDGQGPSLVRDAFYAAREHDQEALERLRRFRVQTEDLCKFVGQRLRFAVNGMLQFAPMTTSNAAEIIPPGYRPDLFVPQLAQDRPFVNSLSRGTITNATPFIVPKFKSASGATGDHTEGQNPGAGTIVFGTETVQPTAISGRMEITREIADASNPAIDAIALNTMRESYAQQTEAKVYAMFNNAQAGTIADGRVPSGAQAAAVGASPDGPKLVLKIREQLANYPFVRFGAPSRALVSRRATVALATATDTTGRLLLPSVGATNAAGVGNAVQQGWTIDGLPHVPAWAILGTGDGDGDVFTINSVDAWAWESPTLMFRYEERSGPAIIELALFGYFGCALLRPEGLSVIRYSDGDAAA